MRSSILLLYTYLDNEGLTAICRINAKRPDRPNLGYTAYMTSTAQLLSAPNPSQQADKVLAPRWCDQASISGVTMFCHRRCRQYYGGLFSLITCGGVAEYPSILRPERRSSVLELSIAVPWA
jgi:hypothetical protein